MFWGGVWGCACSHGVCQQQSWEGTLLLLASPSQELGGKDAQPKVVALHVALPQLLNILHTAEEGLFPCSSGRFSHLQTSVPEVNLAFKFPLGFGITGVGRVGAPCWHQRTGSTACIQGLCMEGHQLPPHRSFIKSHHEFSQSIPILDITRMTRGRGHVSVCAAVGSCCVGVRSLTLVLLSMKRSLQSGKAQN